MVGLELIGIIAAVTGSLLAGETTRRVAARAVASMPELRQRHGQQPRGHTRLNAGYLLLNLVDWFGWLAATALAGQVVAEALIPICIQAEGIEDRTS